MNWGVWFIIISLIILVLIIWSANRQANKLGIGNK
jgi:hypothetical protein